MNGDSTSMVRVSSCRPNPWNRRRPVDPDLVQSMKECGLLQPIVVREKDDGHEIIAGERRWMAACELGWEFMSAVVREATDIEARELCLVENCQRENLTSIEEAKEIAVLLELHHDDVAEVAAKLGRSRHYVRSRAKLANLDVAMFDDMEIGIANVPVACQELLAKLPTDIQRRIVNEHPWAIPNLYRLECAVAALTHQVAFAPFDQTECRACPKRTGADPDLFGGAGGQGITAEDRCLDRECYAAKEREFVDGVVARERERHDPVRLVARDIPPEIYEEAKTRKVGILDAPFRADFATCRKTDTGAVRAVIWCGEGTGQALWVHAVEPDDGGMTADERKAAWIAEHIRQRIRKAISVIPDAETDKLIKVLEEATGIEHDETLSMIQRVAERRFS